MKTRDAIFRRLLVIIGKQQKLMSTRLRRQLTPDEKKLGRDLRKEWGEKAAEAGLTSLDIGSVDGQLNALWRGVCLSEPFAQFGKKGGEKAAQNMTPEERTERARKAALARVAKARAKKGDK